MQGSPLESVSPLETLGRDVLGEVAMRLEPSSLHALALASRRCAAAVRTVSPRLRAMWRRQQRRTRRWRLSDVSTECWVWPSGQLVDDAPRYVWVIPHRVGGPGCAEYLLRWTPDEGLRCWEINGWKYALRSISREWGERLSVDRGCYDDYVFERWDEPPAKVRLLNDYAAACRAANVPVPVIEEFGVVEPLDDDHFDDWLEADSEGWLLGTIDSCYSEEEEDAGE